MMTGLKPSRILLALVVIGGIALVRQFDWLPTAASTAPAGASETITAVIAEQRSGVMIEARGEVVRMLSDDHEGSRHQRFILRLAGGDTLLIAHNIDLAPRVPLREGDEIEFFGQYEWNDKGGVVHWTHHDPQGRHQEGWIRHAGKTYE